VLLPPTSLLLRRRSRAGVNPAEKVFDWDNLERNLSDIGTHHRAASNEEAFDPPVRRGALHSECLKGRSDSRREPLDPFGMLYRRLPLFGEMLREFASHFARTQGTD
jgi:hypothetical protein